MYDIPPFIDTSRHHVEALDTFMRDVDLSGYHRHMSFDPRKPFNDLPALPLGRTSSHAPS